MVGLTACDNNERTPIPSTAIASLGTPSTNEILFVTTDGKALLDIDTAAFDAEITDIIYSEFDKCVIRFASKLTAVGAEAFYNCHNLFNIALPHSVQSIGKRAFYDCKNMECLTLGVLLNSCHSMAFDGCYNLLSVHISSLKNWCKIDFADKRANPIYFSQALILENADITNLAIPEGVASIGKYAFYGNATLQSVTLPSSVTAIGEYAFGECENIRSVNISDLGKWCAIDFGNEKSNPLSAEGSLYLNGELVSEIALSGVESISARAFINYKKITSLTADNKLQRIGEEAFRNCSALTTATLGESIEEIGARAFMGCSALQSVTIPRAEPPLLGDEYVFDYNAQERKIFIPSDAYDIYIMAPYWSKYSNNIERL